MGGGSYDYTSSMTRSRAYSGKSTYEIFSSKNINNAMNPSGVIMRESCDSEEHPESVAIIIALDVTGSMGSIPHYLIMQGLANIMKSIIEKGIKHPQVLLLGIGDHSCDYAPLQVGQFESSDELLDLWLKKIWLESGGGGNDGESYQLAWYFASQHTKIDCFVKRKQKGFLFTIGDEKVLKSISNTDLSRIMGDGQYDTYNSIELLNKAQEKYNVKHIHIKQGSNGRREDIINDWKQLIGENLIIADKKEDIDKIISDNIVIEKQSDLTIDDSSVKNEEIIL